MKTLNEVLEVARCTRDDFNNWLRRKAIRTALPESQQGSARKLTRANALEIALLSAFTSGGLPLAKAVDFVSRTFDHIERRGVEVMAYNPRRREASLMLRSHLVVEGVDWIEAARQVMPDITKGGMTPHGSADTICVIDVPEILARVHALYETAQADPPATSSAATKPSKTRA